ncbi:hypothetical protein FRC18_009164 [Serendipita sp. 400]|nr:hypothetical protein FRC18_009164 [Serendipita sp. 400]
MAAHLYLLYEIADSVATSERQDMLDSIRRSSNKLALSEEQFPVDSDRITQKYMRLPMHEKVAWRRKAREQMAPCPWCFKMVAKVTLRQHMKDCMAKYPYAAKNYGAK